MRWGGAGGGEEWGGWARCSAPGIAAWKLTNADVTDTDLDRGIRFRGDRSIDVWFQVAVYGIATYKRRGGTASCSAPVDPLCGKPCGLGACRYILASKPDEYVMIYYIGALPVPSEWPPAHVRRWLRLGINIQFPNHARCGALQATMMLGRGTAGRQCTPGMPPPPHPLTLSAGA